MVDKGLCVAIEDKLQENTLFMQAEIHNNKEVFVENCKDNFVLSCQFIAEIFFPEINSSDL